MRAGELEKARKGQENEGNGIKKKNLSNGKTYLLSS
jgi:hypothetical protein